MAAPQPAASAADIFGAGGFGGAGGLDQSFASHAPVAPSHPMQGGYDHPAPMFGAAPPGQGMGMGGPASTAGYGVAAPMQQQAPQGFAQQHSMQAPQQAFAPVPSAAGHMGFRHQPQQPQMQQPMAMVPPAQPMPAPMSQQRAMPAVAAPTPSQGMGWQPGPAKPVAPAPMAPAGPPMAMGMQQQQVQPPQPMAAPSLQQPAAVSSAPAEFYAGIDTMRGLIPMLQSSVQLNAAELKQLQEAGQALDVLAVSVVCLLSLRPIEPHPLARPFNSLPTPTLMQAKASSGALKADVIAKVMELSSCLGQHDFKKGPKLLAELASAEWAQTKEWLRGIRGLVTLCVTKSGQR